MQLMWTTSPLGKLHCVALQKRRIAISVAAAAALFVICGVAASVIAFKLAFRYDPDLVASIGGVLTVTEAEKRESTYRKKLKELHAEVAAAREQLVQLQALKEEFARLATPRPVRRDSQRAKDAGGQGGPHLALAEDKAAGGDDEPWSVSEYVASARSRLEELNGELTEAHQHWRLELKRLQRLPTGAPLAIYPGVSSGFGARLDPFTQLPSRHEGIDIGAPAGTPIFATASGVVARVVNDPQYGRMVDIDHGEGYLTRYAHMQAVHVKAGQKLQRGAVIGAVGSTGRSTAPHLHYEVRLHNRPQNPLDYGLQRN